LLLGFRWKSFFFINLFFFLPDSAVVVDHSQKSVAYKLGLLF